MYLKYNLKELYQNLCRIEKADVTGVPQFSKFSVHTNIM